MYKYIKVYNLGFDEGIKDAYKDYINNKEKNFKKIDDSRVVSNIYNIAYIKGYNKLIKVIKNYLYFNKKI